MQTATIYGLCDPRLDGLAAIRYIGVTTRDLAWRLRGHIADATSERLRHRNHRTNWIRSLLRDGVRPQLIVLEKCDGDGFARECEVIAEYRAKGCNLTNSTDGGEGTPGLHPTPEHRAKLGKASRRKWDDPAFRQRMTAAMKESAQDPVRRARVSAAHTGVPHSDETRRRQAEGVRRAWASVPIEERRKRIAPARALAHTPETRAKISRTLTGRAGRRHSDETRRKISEAHKGKIVSPETGARISAGKRNPPPEVRARMSAAASRRWAENPAAQTACSQKRWAGVDREVLRQHMLVLNAKAHTPEAKAKRSEAMRRVWERKREESHAA